MIRIVVNWYYFNKYLSNNVFLFEFNYILFFICSFNYLFFWRYMYYDKCFVYFFKCWYIYELRKRGNLFIIYLIKKSFI